MATGVEAAALNDEQRQTLNAILRPHLRLDTVLDDTSKRGSQPAQRLEDIGVHFKKPDGQQVGRGSIGNLVS